MDSEEERELFGSSSSAQSAEDENEEEEENEIKFDMSKKFVQTCVLDLARYLIFTYIYQSNENFIDDKIMKQKFLVAQTYIDFVKKKLDEKLRLDIIRHKHLPCHNNMLVFLDGLQTCEELHIRHTRINPAKPRTTAAVAEEKAAIYSIVDGKKIIFDADTRASETPKSITWKNGKVHNVVSKKDASSDFDKAPERHYRTLILRPALKDDTNPMAVLAEKELEPPFGIVLKKNWAQLFQLYHSIWWFESYINNNVVGTINDSTRVKLSKLSWEKTWKRLTGRFHEKPISNYSRQNNIKERVVAEIAKGRDLFWQTWQFLRK